MTTEEFLRALFGETAEGALEVWCSTPKGVDLRPRNKVLWKSLPLGDFRFAGSLADSLNHAGYGISFGVCVRREKRGPEQRISPTTGKPYTMNHPRGSEGDAIYLPALWIDVDGNTPDHIERIHLPPSITVSSGGGHHAYWLLNQLLPITDDNRKEIKRTLKGMAIKADSDKAVAELSRAMRLPGTINTKPERNGARCEVIDADLTRRYQFEDFAAYAFLGGPREPEYPITRQIPTRAAEALPPWVEGYITSGAPQSERNHTLFRAACTYFSHGRSYADAERDLGARAHRDGLEPAEIRATLNSAWRKAGGTVTLPPDTQRRMSVADKQIGLDPRF